MMTTGEVRALADDVLRPILSSWGFRHCVVEAGPDHYDEDSLFVRALMDPDADVLDGVVAGDARMTLLYSLEKQGETRFAFLTFDYAEDEAADGVGTAAALV